MRRRTRIGLALGAAALSLAAVAQERPAQAPVEAPAAAAGFREPPPAGLYAGPLSCGGSAGAGCHGYETPRDLYDVNQDEIALWTGSRHQRAYETLFEERSRAIAKNLGLGDPAEAPACLACHTLSVPAGAQRREIDPLDGVSCESCHGPASGWGQEHNAEDWTYADSVAAGMVDLADLEVRTRTCLGCHLGEPGRRVDHDLIAAGHPALPFELRNFSAEIPEHWRSGPEERLREWAVGQPAALRTAAVELGRRAREGRWPDFSVLACESCHHALDEERYRRPDALAGGAGSPYSARIGLPPWSPARWAVLRVLVERYAPEALPGLDRSVQELSRQVSRLSAPPAEVTAAADDLARLLAPVVDRMEAVAWRPEEARAVARALASRGDALDDDLDTAMQAVQAMYSLAGYLLDSRPESARSGMVEALTALTDTVERPDRFDRARFRSALAELGERIR